MATTTETSTLPDQTATNELLALSVLDKNGGSVPFGSLVATGRVITVFIRHFFCGNCMEYVRALTRSLSPDVLSHMSPPTKLIIIGCGEPSAIQRYTIDVPCPYEVYADPTRATYDKLAFVVSLSGGNGKPEYITRGFVAGLKESMGAMLAAGLRGGGKFSQNGGELIWVDGSLRFLHRMVDTTGHLEVKDLETELNKASSTAGEKENTDVAPIVAA